MTDERLTNLAMISIESNETAKSLDMTELTKTFASLKIWKKSFSYLEIQQILKSVCFICVLTLKEHAFINIC